MIEVTTMSDRALMAVVKDPHHSDQERQAARQEIARRSHMARIMSPTRANHENVVGDAQF